MPADPPRKATPAGRKQGGRWWLWPFGIAVLAVALLSTLRWLVQPERLGRFLLARAEAESGLDLQVDSPPRLGIWPRLHLQLTGLQIRDPALPDTLLAQVDQVALYLPLSALRGEVRVDAIALHGPQLDLAALARRSAGQMGPPGSPWLPPVTRLQIEEGRLVDAGWQIDALDLELQQLMVPGHILALQLQATLRIDGRPALPLALGLQAENPADPAELRWRILQLQLGDHERPLIEADSGLLAVPDWSAPRIELAGKLMGWPASWPAVPEMLPPLLPGLALQLRLDPRDPAAALQLAVDGAQRRGGLRVHPAELADWLATGDWSAPMPGSARLEMDALQIDGVRIEGLQLRHGQDAVD